MFRTENKNMKISDQQVQQNIRRSPRIASIRMYHYNSEMLGLIVATLKDFY